MNNIKKKSFPKNFIFLLYFWQSLSGSNQFTYLILTETLTITLLKI